MGIGGDSGVVEASGIAETDEMAVGKRNATA